MVSTYRSWMIIITVAVTSVLTGCASQDRTSPARRSSDTHLVFNPEWTGIGPSWVGRRDWPSTDGVISGHEVIEYRETIQDQGNRGTHGSTDYYRRFYSVRRGRQIR